MIREYTIKKTLPATVKANHLRASDRDDIYYDVSLLEGISGLSEREKELIITDLIEHHSITWYNQPLPICILDGQFASFHGQIDTAYTKVYRSSGKRMMVIITVTAAEVVKSERSSVYQAYYQETHRYNTKSPFHKGEYPDVEVA